MDFGHNPHRDRGAAGMGMQCQKHMALPASEFPGLDNQRHTDS